MGWREKIRIITIEDDESFGTAINEAVTRHGYSSSLIKKPEEILNIVKTQPINGIIVDCMLPQINGVELLKRIKNQIGYTIPSILISGIFKDKSFIRDAIKETEAIAFLTKPFIVNDLIKILDEKFEVEAEIEIAPLYQSLSRSNNYKTTILKTISSLDSIHGFDLPIVYNLLIESEASGHLNIINEKGDVSGISFCKGSIVHVDIKDEDSYIGRLLVEKGFISSKDLKEISYIQDGKPIGQRMIEANLLSPHAIPIALVEQMSIRLGKVICDNVIRINFSEIEIPEKKPSINKLNLYPYIHDWVTSKISIKWIKSFYRNWLDYRIDKDVQFSDEHYVWSTPLLKQMVDFKDKIELSLTIQNLIDIGLYSEDEIYRALHLLFIFKLITFKKNNKTVNYSNHMLRIRKLAHEIENKNYFEIFEILGVSRNSSDAEITKAYKEISKFLHPDKLMDAPIEVKEITLEVFSKISAAHSVLVNKNERSKYLDELGSKEAALQIKFESIIDQGKDLLKKGKIKEAVEAFESAKHIMEPSVELKLYIIWAKLKGVGGKSASSKFLKDIDMELMQIPPEERHSALYYFVKGLYKKLIGDQDMARRNFELAVNDDPNMIEAKRELNMVTLAVEKHENLMRSDLKNMIKSLFRKH